MATLAGVIYTSHAWATRPWREWLVEREIRHLRADVPRESEEEMEAKAARMTRAVDALGQRLAELRPDALVIFGDDQHECFEFSNFPSIAVFLGASFTGRGPLHTTASGHPPLATALLTGLMARGFDPAFMLDLPNPTIGMSHAVMNPIEWFGAERIPTVPLLLNAYYAPQASATRHLEVGRAVRRIIEDYPSDERIVVVGSGGLWHTPRAEGAHLDEEFDRRGLEYLRRGEIEDWASMFDSYVPPPDDSSQSGTHEVPAAEQRRGDVVTHLPGRGGPQGGTRETCNWIGAAGVVEGLPHVIVDYVPLYAAPIGVGFAYCDLPA